MKPKWLLTMGSVGAAGLAVAGLTLGGPAPQTSSQPGTGKAVPTEVLGETILATATCPPAGFVFCIQGSVTNVGPLSPRTLTLTLINPNSFPIFVTSLTVSASDNGSCPGSITVKSPGWAASDTSPIPTDSIQVPPTNSSGPGTATKNVAVTWADSTTVNQTPCLGGTSIPLTYGGQALWNANCITGSQSGNLTVTSGQVVCITKTGSLTGNVTVNSGGTLELTGGKVGGNLQSAGAVSLTVGSSVGGNLQTTGGGPVNIAGASIGGNLQLQSQTAGPDTICGTTVKGNVQVQSNAGAIQIGGSSSCAGNTVGGNLQVQSNSGNLTIGAKGYGNSAGGNIQVQNNTGGGTLSYNAASGNCQLQGDKPGIVGTGNSGKNNSCNVGGPGA